MDELFLELENFIHENNTKDVEKIIVTQEEIDYEWEIIKNNNSGIHSGKNKVINMLKRLQLNIEIYTDTITNFNHLVKLTNKDIKMKRAIMCAVIYVSLKNYNHIPDENHLIEYFKISKKKFLKALSFTKQNIPYSRCQQILFKDDLYLLCLKYNLENKYDIILQYVISKGKNCKSVSFGHVYIWMMCNIKIIPDLASYAKNCKLSVSTLSKIIYKNRDDYENYFVNIYAQQIKHFYISLNVLENVSNNDIKYIVKKYIKTQI